EWEIVGEAEGRQWLTRWNDAATEYPREQRIHELFEAQAALRPDAVALVYEEQQVSYRELNGRANQLARRLGRLGVEADVRAGLCVERSGEMRGGGLGILKTGAAYVPREPGI